MLSRDFSRRAAPHTLPEWMDDPDVDAATFRDCVASLSRVNALSFGYRPTVQFVRQLAERAGERPIRVLDVGSGYGDTLRAIASDLNRRGLRAELTGADLNPHATASAQAATRDVPGVSITFSTQDARTLAAGADKFDAVICALFCHHLEDDELVEFIRFLEGAATLGWLVNDLYRSKFAAVGFGLAATVAAQHRFVRHDGPVSFARSFRRADWTDVLVKAGVPAGAAHIFIGAPFRLCVARMHND